MSEWTKVILAGRFLYRDLLYMSGGFIVWSVPFTAHSMLDKVKDAPLWLIIPLLFASYIVGFVATEIGLGLRIFRILTTKGTWIDNEVSQVILRGQVSARLHFEEMIHLDRIDFLKFLSAVIGSSSLLAYLLLQVYVYFGWLEIPQFVWGLLSIGLVITVVIMRNRSLQAAAVHDKILSDFWRIQVASAPVETNKGA